MTQAQALQNIFMKLSSQNRAVLMRDANTLEVGQSNPPRDERKEEKKEEKKEER